MRGAEGTTFVDTKDVDWLKAVENYVELHVGRDCYLVEGTMSEIANAWTALASSEFTVP